MEIVDSIRRIMDEQAPLMQPAQEYSRQMDGKASMFVIDVNQGAKAYRYDVDIRIRWTDENIAQEFDKSLAKGSDEGLRSRNRYLCYDLLATAYQLSNFLRGDGEIVYDCKSTLYTSKPVEIGALDNPIEFPIRESSDYVQQYCARDSIATVTLRQNKSGHILELDNLGQYIQKETIHVENRSLRTFFEMAVAQVGLNRYLYTAIGAGQLFQTTEDRELPRAGNGMVLRSGIVKGVRIVKGGSGFPTPSPALVIDVKVSPFFTNQEVFATVTEIIGRRNPDWGEVAKLLHGIRVEVTYQRNRTFSIKELTPVNIRQIMVQYNGRQMSLEEYYRDSIGYQIQRLDTPAIVPHFDVDNAQNPDGYFPMELLFIMPDQRVSLEKMSPQLLQNLLAANSLRPEDRYNRVIEHCWQLNLFSDDNPVLNAFGIRIHRDSNLCKINVRRPPQILFRDGRPLNVNAVQADWKRVSEGHKFYSVDLITNWVILCLPEHRQQIQQFASDFMSAAERRGMEFAQRPRILDLIVQGTQWSDLFEEFSKENVQFVLLIDFKNMDTHGILKYYEVRKKILTQHVTFERVKDVIARNGKGRQTLENILNKTNLKYSGMNYRPLFENSSARFRLENNYVLVVGYDVAQPPPMSMMERRMCQAVRKDLLSFDPAVVGITGNIATDPHNFVGDYYFQEAKREGLDYGQLASRFCWLLQMLKTFRPEASRPKYIFIIRNGLSEGQFAQSVQNEVNALRNGAMEYASEFGLTSYNPKFLYVLGTKRHFKKFYSLDNQRHIQNLVPGSVVDHKFVREDCPEFFMQSHYALKGVGKPVEYNILLDEIDVNKDEIEGLLNSLCYTHQIVNSAVSMPEPVYQADELAKRGRNNYITMKRLHQAEIPREAQNNFVDVQRLNEILTYRNHEIFISTRFTA